MDAGRCGDEDYVSRHLGPGQVFLIPADDATSAGERVSRYGHPKLSERKNRLDGVVFLFLFFFAAPKTVRFLGTCHRIT